MTPSQGGTLITLINEHRRRWGHLAVAVELNYVDAEIHERRSKYNEARAELAELIATLITE